MQICVFSKRQFLASTKFTAAFSITGFPLSGFLYPVSGLIGTGLPDIKNTIIQCIPSSNPQKIINYGYQAGTTKIKFNKNNYTNCLIPYELGLEGKTFRRWHKRIPTSRLSSSLPILGCRGGPRLSSNLLIKTCR